MNAIALKLECSLTALDWQVVEVARLDGPRSINPDGRFTRFLRDFFGLPITRNSRTALLMPFSRRGPRSCSVNRPSTRPNSSRRACPAPRESTCPR